MITAGVLLGTPGLAAAASYAGPGNGPGSCQSGGKGQTVHDGQMAIPLDICPTAN